MLIAHLIDTLGLGGAQQLLVTFAQTAKARSLRTVIISLRRHRPVGTPVLAALDRLGVTVHELTFRKFAEPANIARLIAVLRQERPDVLQTHLGLSNLLGAATGRYVGLPVVATLHNTLDQPHKRRRPISHALETLALRYLVQRIVAVGQATAASHQKRLAGRSLDVVPNAVAIIPPLTPEKRDALRRSVIGDATRPLLIAVGRLTGQKAYGDLLTAFAAMRIAHPRAALIIAGDGNLREAVAAQIAALGLEGDVRLLGLRTDVPELLAASDVFVSTAHWEGLPVAVLEAMSAGLPVVATSVGDIPSIVAPGTGWLLPPRQPDRFAAALRWTLDHPAEQLAAGRAAQAHVHSLYGPDAWVDRLLTVYQKAGAPNVARMVGAASPAA